MNNDGWGFNGAGTSDNRVIGIDPQHARQNAIQEKYKRPTRIVTQPSESGGPMKHQGLKDRMDESLSARHGAERNHSQSMGDRRHESEGMHRHLEEEKNRHEKAMDHHKHHLEKHHGRNYDSQHGHDTYKY